MTIAPAEANVKGSWELFCEEGEMKLYTRQVRDFSREHLGCRMRLKSLIWFEKFSRRHFTANKF